MYSMNIYYKLKYKINNYNFTENELTFIKNKLIKHKTIKYRRIMYIYYILVLILQIYHTNTTKLYLSFTISYQ